MNEKIRLGRSYEARPAKIMAYVIEFKTNHDGNSPIIA